MSDDEESNCDRFPAAVRNAQHDSKSDFEHNSNTDNDDVDDDVRSGRSRTDAIHRSDEDSVDVGYNEVAGDFTNANEGLFDYDANNYDDDDDDWDDDYPDDFPPSLLSYVSANPANQIAIVFNKGQRLGWRQIKKEVCYFRDKFGMGDAAQAMIFDKLFGDESHLFFEWRKIFKKQSPYSEFCKFFATFFFECSFRCHYQWLYDHNEVDTPIYLELKRYNDMWRMIDEYNKYDDFTHRAWEVFESVVNQNCKESFAPTKGEFSQIVSIDDDKHHHNRSVRTKDQPLHENNSLKRTRHARDNANGMTLDALTYPGSGVPIHVHYRRKGESEYHSLKKALQFMYHYGESDNIVNLSGKLLIAADRGYWHPRSLEYVLRTGADVIGTVQRQL